MTFFISDALVVQNQKLSTVVCKVKDVWVRLEPEELSRSDNYFAVGSRIQEIHLRCDFEAEEKRRTVSELFAEFGMHE